MITLYHGGLDIIKSPEIRDPNRTLDFGKGFYLTSSLSQASDWVKRRFDKTIREGYVNEYEFSISESGTQLKVKNFESPDDEWLEFVMANRKIVGFTHDYDVVIGPVANDRVYTAFALYESGTIGKDTLIQELKTYRLVDQYLFHTEKALEYLRYKDAKKIQV